jgi:tetratricopeptide (TPR) repeat protein
MIGNIYLRLGNYDKALENHRKSLSVRKQSILHNIKIGRQGGDDADSVNNLGLAYSYNNIGESYLKMGMLDSAYFYAKKSLKIKQSGKNFATLNDKANSELNLGNILCAMGKYDSAGIWIENALGKYLETKNQVSQTEALYALGELYIKKNYPKQALEFYEKGLKIARNINDLNNVKNGYKHLSDLYHQLSNWELSFLFFEKYTELKDSILNIENLSRIEELQIEYKMDKKNRQIETQKKLIQQKEQNLWLVILIGALIAAMLIIIILFVIITRQHKVKLLQKQAENLRQELELKNKELVCNVRSIYVKNQVINKVARKLSKNVAKDSEDNRKAINSVIHELKNNLDDTGWKEFETRFSQVHESFYNNLQKQFPDLTETDRKLAAMLKLGLSSKEIASITMTRPESVDTARSRLRKKMGLSSNVGLGEFLSGV